MKRAVHSSQLLLAFFCSACLAQTNVAAPAGGHPAPAYLVAKVAAIGSKRFAEADIIRAIGLKPGTSVTADDLKQAADRLGQSSVFSQVSYRFDGQTAEYNVVDAEVLVPARFENYVWFTDDELLEKVHASVSLFQGQLPLAGTLADQVIASLDGLLKERGIPGHSVSATQSAPDGQPQAVRFQVDGLTEKITEIRFPGAAPERLPVLQAATKRLLDTNYIRDPVTEQIRHSTVAAYGKLGFLKARVDPPKPVIVPAIAKDGPQQIQLALEVPIQEGDPYTCSAVNWSGTNAIPPSELAKTVHIKPGDPADTAQLAGVLVAARELYGSRGYMYVQVKSTATLDNDKHTAAFNLNVDEGPVYRMGKLEVQNLDPGRAALVQKVWEIHEGDVYDAAYVNTFLSKHPVELAVLDGWTSRYTQTIHDDTHIVDLTLAFVKIRPDAK